jgi:hypothetical protein
MGEMVQVALGLPRLISSKWFVLNAERAVAGADENVNVPELRPRAAGDLRPGSGGGSVILPIFAKSQPLEKCNEKPLALRMAA